MPRAKNQGWRCKSTAKATGSRCQKRAGDDGYCNVHRAQVGKPGPRTPEGMARSVAASIPASVAANWRHGAFAKRYLTPEQIDLLEEARPLAGSLDVELAQARMRLAWVRRMILNRETGQDQVTGEVVEVLTDEQTAPGQHGIVQRLAVRTRTTRCSLAELYAMEDRALARVQSLEATAAQIRVRSAGGDIQEQVEAFRRLAAEVAQHDITAEEYARRYLTSNIGVEQEQV